MSYYLRNRPEPGDLVYRQEVAFEKQIPWYVTSVINSIVEVSRVCYDQQLETTFLETHKLSIFNYKRQYVPLGSSQKARTVIGDARQVIREFEGE